MIFCLFFPTFQELFCHTICAERTLILINLLYKCPEEHRFQAAGNERKKERILIERMRERKQEKEKERKKERKKERREKERKKEKSRQTAG
jgi:hypothetical protein